MNQRIVFWGLFSAILATTLVTGCVIVPNWPQYTQTTEQRLSYLYESIWCPI